MGENLHLDCVGGLSGDMFLSALSGLLPDPTPLRKIFDRLPVSYAIEFETGEELGMAVRRLKVSADAHGVSLHDPPEIAEALRRSGLPPEVERNALALLDLLARAEARVHGVPVERVHFHELAGADLLLDLVGGAACVHLLKPGRITGSPLPMGQGTIRIAHGVYPLPAPAALDLLTGIPVEPSEIKGETVTPTGAALARHYVSRFQSFARGRVLRTGIGAGERRNPRIPNVLRALWVEEEEEEAFATETLTRLSTNLDDMTPEDLAASAAALMDAGALDVWITPILMKKGRPAHLLSVLARPEAASDLARRIFAQTSTLGVRRERIERMSLPRREVTVETEFGPVRGKASLHEGVERFKPESDDLIRLSAERGRSVAEIRREAERSFRENRDKTGE